MQRVSMNASRVRLSVPSLELHSDKTRSRPGATCQSNQKPFHPF